MGYDKFFGKDSNKTAARLAKEFSLTQDEAFVLAASKVWLMYEDFQAEGNLTARYLKHLVFGDYATAISAALIRDPAWGESFRKIRAVRTLPRRRHPRP